MSHSVLTGGQPNGKSAAGSGATPADGVLLLGRPLGRTTWLGRLDGRAVTARLMTSVGPGPTLRLPEADPATPRNLVDFLGTYAMDGATWSVSEFVPGISLDRLLGVAILTPAQATYIAATIFGGLAELHAHGHSHGDLTSRHVVVGTDGQPRLAGWAVVPNPRFHNFEAARVADLDAGRAVVFELARNADRPVGRHSPGGGRLLVELERLGTGGTLADAAATAQHLEDRLDSAEGMQTGETLMRSEIGALTKAATQDLPAAAGPVVPPPGPVKARPDAARPVPPVSDAPLSGADWKRPRRRKLIWILVAAVVALAAAGFLARHSVSRLADRVLHRNQGSSSSTTTTGTTGHAATGKAHTAGHAAALPRLGPPAGGVVSKVTLRPSAPCRLGRSCAAQVSVSLRPNSSTHLIRWRVVTIDRCTGAQVVRARGVLTVSAGSTFAWDTPRFLLRSRHGVAAVAVTAKPAHAASRPLLVPAHSISC